ncbi:MAG TPA: BON domain-containing protein, partial [Polyangiaceae bacterium]|nr:BON domain-containing protein [Polyangiaceae bacterium]
GSLEHAVQKALGRAHIDAADLRVTAEGSSIRLRGSVRHLFEKTELENRARAVPGVTSVVSELFVLRGGWDENA